MANQPALRVAIVGGGIGGLVLAVALRKLCGDRIRVDIYEAAHAFSEIGAGIGVWPRVWATMEALDLAGDLSAIATGNDSQELQMRRSDNPTEDSASLVDVWIKMGGIRSFHRAQFQAVLTAHLPPSPFYATHFDKRLSSYALTQDGTVTLTFADDTTAVCDLLVGCDGIKSVVRSTLYHSLSTPADPVWSGSVAYRSLIPQEVLQKVNPEHPSLTKGMMCCGASKHMVAFPISNLNRKFVNIVAFVTKPGGEGTKYEGEWMREASKQEVQEAYAGWEPLVMQLIESIDKASLWAINTVPNLPTYVGERVALLGDSAHAMNPHQGSGAGQAIEDSFVLASLLADPRVTRRTLPKVLEIYDSIRRPVSQDVARRSRDQGLVYDCILSPADAGVDVAGDSLADDLVARSTVAQQMLLWAKETTIMVDRDKALQALDATLNTTGP
ncbi:FAD/NAD-P-binding domain-containing protein [Fomitopsis betulina]|nr:FAD/NAD-P-binding domain-containing protein [Fomitopsis betulina]